MAVAVGGTSKKATGRYACVPGAGEGRGAVGVGGAVRDAVGVAGGVGDAVAGAVGVALAVGRG